MLFLSRSKNKKKNTEKGEKGQSFVELALVVVFLMIFVAGVIEFGLLLNQYLNLVDASREAVRYSADSDPFVRDANGDLVFDGSGNKLVNNAFFEQTATLTKDVLAPVKLNPAIGDDIVISFFSVGNGVFIRYPLGTDGWSANGNKVSKLSSAEVQSRVDSGAPPTGVLLIEIFYNYPQVLNLPVFTAFIPNPIPVYVYSIMPLTAAEP